MRNLDFRNLDPETIKTYIRERTRLFPAAARLSVYEFGRNPDDGDGYVNHIYRISDETGRSVILKQAKPFLKALGEGVMPLVTGRNKMEVDIMRIRSAIVPAYMARVLHADPENNLYICEDWGRLGVMRFELCRGKVFPQFPGWIGEYMAKSNFYTSELYFDQRAFRRMDARFCNPDMLVILETFLFQRESLIDSVRAVAAAPDPQHRAASDAFWSRRDVRLELLKLRDIYMKKHECLCHGDLHTSNILIGSEDMKVFDMEYTFMGPFSADGGYLLGNLVYVYIASFYRDELPEAVRRKQREWAISCIGETLARYFRVFAECWARDAKPLFRELPEYLAELCAAYLREVCGFMGAQISSRVGGFAELPDFDTIPDRDKRNEARALALATAYNLIVSWQTVESAEDILRIVTESAQAFFRSAKTLP